MNLKIGDQSKGICPNCDDVVNTTLRNREIKTGKFDYGRMNVFCCNICGNIVGIPVPSLFKDN